MQYSFCKDKKPQSDFNCSLKVKYELGYMVKTSLNVILNS